MAKIGDKLDMAKLIVAILLTFVAGYVDAIGWLSLDRVYAAQMSGNVVLLAVHLATGEGGHAALQATMIVTFFLGLVLSGSVIEIGMRLRIRRILAAALLIEFVLLGIFAVAGSTAWAHLKSNSADVEPDLPVYLLGAVIALAMGAQNTSLRMAGILTVYTTHVTGTITNLSEEIIIRGFAMLAPARHRRHDGFVSAALRTRPPVEIVHIGRTAGLIGGFFLGALAGASLLGAGGFLHAMVLPLLLLIAIGVFDWLVPLTRFPSDVDLA
jgi:uncharacterized membrane protein YoaK (UPF0700 family)